MNKNNYLNIPKDSRLICETEHIRIVYNKENKIVKGALTKNGVIELTDVASIHPIDKWDIKRLSDGMVYLIIER